MSSTPTGHTGTCATCAQVVRWHRHPPDAVNPVGLWHHDVAELDDDHDPLPEENAARYEQEWRS